MSQRIDAPVLSHSQVEGRDDALTYRWMRLVDAVAAQVGGNPKLHAIGDLALSFLENGFADPPKWDVNLNHGRGGIVYGNGRLEALAWLEHMHRNGQPLNGESVPRPRGVGTERDTGVWCVQVAFGLDSESETQAQRFLIDHNNLTLAGGTSRALDMARMYDPERYRAMLERIEGFLGASADDRLLNDGQITLTVDTSDLELLVRAYREDQDTPLDLGARPLGQSDSEDEAGKGGIAMATLKLSYNPEHFAEVEALMKELMLWLDATNQPDCILKALRECKRFKNLPREA